MISRIRKVKLSHQGLFLGLTISVVGLVMFGAFILIAQLFLMEKQLDDTNWQLPATIYAEPPSISPGKVASREWLVRYLQRLNYSESSTTQLQPGQFAYADGAIVFRKRPFRHEDTPPLRVSFDNQRIQSVVDLGTNTRIDSYTLEPTPLATLFGSEWEKRTLVRLDDLPKHVLDAVISIEDRRFYKHSGVDLASVARAVVTNLFGEGPMQGGSTITQQLVKNLYLSPEKTLRRKISEATMAILMEAKYSKNDILENYLNEVYLGQRGPVSIKGIGEAAQLYFKKDARLLTVPEAATIAGLIQAPSRYDPYRHPDKTKLRRNAVLLAMRETGALSSDECNRYMATQIVVQAPDTRINRAPYFMTYLKKQLREQFSSRTLHQDDFQIISTLDYDMQIAAQNALAEGLASIDRYRGKRKPVQGSLIAIQPSTGKILAFVGGRNFSGSQFDRLTQARRQPGSSFKPFVYAAALETAFDSQNRFYTTSSLIEDEPWSVRIDKAVWQPQNYNGSYNGVVSLRTALAKSMNIATAKLAYDVGFYKVYNLARKMGFNNVHPYPSIALGAFEVSPFQLIQAYTAFANAGKVVELQAISQVRNSQGELVRERNAQEFRVLHEQTAYLITDMLKTVMRSGTAASVSRWGINRVLAGKTGTTNDQKDAWFIGYTPDLIALVWVGYDDNTPVRMTGAEAALPIWGRFMRKIAPSLPSRDFPRPRGIVERMIDPYTGKLASYSCPNSVREMFIEGTEPYAQCTEADHYLPVDYFVGPETRVQHANYYTSEGENLDNYNYANISYDSSTYTFKNYEDSDGTDVDQYNQYQDRQDSQEMIDYSDQSFPEHQDGYTAEQQADEDEPEYQGPVTNDFEAPPAEQQEFSADESAEVPPDSQNQQNLAPVYIAPSHKNPAHKKKKAVVYTNEDIPEAESTTDADDDQD
jgi:penicillin-binding protein 1B